MENDHECQFHYFYLAYLEKWDFSIVVEFYHNGIQIITEKD